MRQSNIDISKLPKFTSHQEAEDYFSKYGKMEFFGVELTKPFYYVFKLTRSNGIEYFIDIYEDGTVVVIQRGTDISRDF